MTIPFLFDGGEFPIRTIHPLGEGCGYVESGLIAWWDGIWNVGRGVHDPSSSTWKDLVGDKDLALASSGVSWSINALVSNVSSGCAAKCASGIVTEGNIYTVEMVKGTTTGRCHLILNPGDFTTSTTNAVFFLGAGGSQFRVAFGQANNSRLEAAHENISTAHTISVRYSIPGAVAASVVVNGVQVETSHDGSWSNDPSELYRGIRLFGRTDNDGYGSNRYPVKGNCHCIRVYNRVLSDEEVAYNHELDRMRFLI